MVRKSENIRIAFLGTPQFATMILRVLIDSPFRPVIVVTERDKPVGRRQILTPPPVKVVAQAAGIPVVQPTSHREFFDVIQAAHIDLGIVAAYGRILRPELLAVPYHGFLNIHASLLPKYRGASPIQAAILAGDTETGVTLMRIDSDLDTGPLVSSRPVSVSPADTTPVLAEKLAQVGARLLLETLPEYLTGSLHPTPQPTTGVSVTKLITKEAGRLTGHEKVGQIEGMLRAYTPWPGVWLEIDGQRLLILAGHCTGKHFIPDRVQLAGKIAVDWSIFQRDRSVLAHRILTLLP